MNTNGTRYSPAFKFQVVLEILRAEGKGTEAQVARAYGVHLPALPLKEAHHLEEVWKSG